jgi:thioredoxin
MISRDTGSDSGYTEAAYSVETIGELSGSTLLEFGAPWCGHCKAASSAISEVVNQHPELRHIKIYDGKGKPLGRAFKVKLWPTLIILREGSEVDRLVRPLIADEVRQLLSKLN